MKAVVLSRFGGPDALELRDVPDPEAPGPGRVLVKVRAAAVNYADVLVRSGTYPQPPDLPVVLGLEVAGEVTSVGKGVTSVARGDRVVALTGESGGYAERAAVDEQWTFVLPPNAGFAEGAGFLLASLTAYVALTRQARVGAGSSVVVHAAAGGVGGAAVQIARHLGATVIAAVGSGEKAEAARELGAGVTVNYREADLVARVRDATGGRGADVVLDPVGGPLFETAVRALAPLGVVLAIGSAAGPWTPIDPALLVGRNVGIHGLYLGRLIRLMPTAIRTAADELMGLWREGVVRARVGGEFPLVDAPAAHELLEQRASVGKLVLEP